MQTGTNVQTAEKTSAEYNMERTEPAPKLPVEFKQGATEVAGKLNHGSLIGDPRQLHYPPSIAKAILTVSKEIGGVAKDGENKFQNYRYQAWDDIVRALQPALLEAGLIVTQSETGRSITDRLVSVTYEFMLIHSEGDVWPERLVWTGMARLIDSKGVMDDKAINKCATQAHKYWAIHTFSIRTPDAEDSDGDAPAKPAPKEKGPTISKVPHAIVVKGEGSVGWARAYMGALRTAETAEILDAWYLENRHNLVILRKTDTKNYKACEEAYSRRRDELKKPAAQKELPPRVDQPKDAPGVIREVTDPKTGEVIDQEEWLRDLEGALGGSEDLSELARIKTAMLLPMQGVVGKDFWSLATRLYTARVTAVMGDDITAAG